MNAPTINLEMTAPRAETVRQAPRRIFGQVRPLSRLVLFIVALNAVAMVSMVVAIRGIDQSRDRLIEAKVDALKGQALMMAGALAESVGEVVSESRLEHAATASIMRRLALGDEVRARLYAPDGQLVQDTDLLITRRQVEVTPLPSVLEPAAKRPAVDPGGPVETLWDRLYRVYEGIFYADDHLPLYRDYPRSDGLRYEEVLGAVGGEMRSAKRRSPDGELIVSIAVPVQRYKGILGVLLLTTEGGDIEAAIRQDRVVTLVVLLVGLAIGLASSAALAFWIAAPINRLAAAADRATSGSTASLLAVPDFSTRKDEIGDLSVSLRAMTSALHERLESNARFAADVSHEIKNPLTSIRSAVETIERSDDPERRAKLLAIVKDDVRRLDRLITDISDASRVDAELARDAPEPLNLERLLDALVMLSDATRKEGEAAVTIDISGLEGGSAWVLGWEGRLVQVFRNLLSNAVSFSPSGSTVTVSILRDKPGHAVVARVDDCGPGIPDENLETIFERFYTSRPSAGGFGNNSGLGLSISRQIVEAHRGRLTASNRVDPVTGRRLGARFEVRLPIP